MRAIKPAVPTDQAGPTRPTTRSIETLLALSRPECLMETVSESLEHAMQRSVNEVLRDRTLSPRRRLALERVPGKVIDVLRAEWNWNVLRPQLVKLYRDSFEQQEIDGLIEFFRSAAGRTYLSKMPMVMHRSIALAHSHVERLLPKAREAMEAAIREAESAVEITSPAKVADRAARANGGGRRLDGVTPRRPAT